MATRPILTHYFGRPIAILLALSLAFGPSPAHALKPTETQESAGLESLEDALAPVQEPAAGLEGLDEEEVEKVLDALASSQVDRLAWAAEQARQRLVIPLADGFLRMAPALQPPESPHIAGRLAHFQELLSIQRDAIRQLRQTEDWARELFTRARARSLRLLSYPPMNAVITRWIDALQLYGQVGTIAGLSLSRYRDELRLHDFTSQVPGLSQVMEEREQVLADMFSEVDRLHAEIRRMSASIPQLFSLLAAGLEQIKTLEDLIDRFPRLVVPGARLEVFPGMFVVMNSERTLAYYRETLRIGSHQIERVAKILHELEEAESAFQRQFPGISPFDYIHLQSGPAVALTASLKSPDSPLKGFALYLEHIFSGDLNLLGQLYVPWHEAGELVQHEDQSVFDRMALAEEKGEDPWRVLAEFVADGFPGHRYLSGPALSAEDLQVQGVWDLLLSPQRDSPLAPLSSGHKMWDLTADLIALRLAGTREGASQGFAELMDYDEQLIAKRADNHWQGLSKGEIVSDLATVTVNQSLGEYVKNEQRTRKSADLAEKALRVLGDRFEAGYMRSARDVVLKNYRTIALELKFKVPAAGLEAGPPKPFSFLADQGSPTRFASQSEASGAGGLEEALTAGLEETQQAALAKVRQAIEAWPLRQLPAVIQGEDVQGMGVLVKFGPLEGFVPGRLVLDSSGGVLSDLARKAWVKRLENREVPALPVEITERGRPIFALIYPDGMQHPIKTPQDLLRDPAAFRIQSSRRRRPEVLRAFLQFLHREGENPVQALVEWHSDPKAWERSASPSQRYWIITWLGEHLSSWTAQQDPFGFFEKVATRGPLTELGDFPITRAAAVKVMRRLAQTDSQGARVEEAIEQVWQKYVFKELKENSPRREYAEKALRFLAETARRLGTPRALALLDSLQAHARGNPAGLEEGVGVRSSPEKRLRQWFRLLGEVAPGTRAVLIGSAAFGQTAGLEEFLAQMPEELGRRVVAIADSDTVERLRWKTRVQAVVDPEDAVIALGSMAGLESVAYVGPGPEGPAVLVQGRMIGLPIQTVLLAPNTDLVEIAFLLSRGLGAPDSIPERFDPAGLEELRRAA